MTGKYDDILRLPHHVSASRKPMAMTARASQFAPFAALSGYDAEVQEAGRLTDRPIEPDEYEKEAMNARLQLLARHFREKWVVSLVFFQPDERKAGGSYQSAEGIVKRIDTVAGVLLMADCKAIPIADIFDIEIIP